MDNATFTPTLWPRETLIPVAATATHTPEPVTLETTEGLDVSDRDKVGEVEISYPVRMSPGSSDIVQVAIHVPPELASLAPVEVARVPIPPDSPPYLGEQETYRTTILVAETMRVELSSPSFETEGLHPQTQEVVLHGAGEFTVWAWSIRAPHDRGLHILTVRIYLRDSADPSWVGGIQVEVVDLTPTAPPTDEGRGSATPEELPSATATSAPPGIDQPARDTILVVLAVIIFALVLGLAVALGLLLARRRRADSRRARLISGAPRRSTAPIRQLLLATFSAEELRRFCQDREPFSPVLAEFGPSHGLSQMVDRLIDYCQRHMLFDELLDEIRVHNPRQWERFKPYL